METTTDLSPAAPTSSPDVTMDSTPAPTPTKTPNKRKTPMKATNDDDGYDADASPAKKPKATPKRQRKTNKTPNKAIPMGTTYDLCGEHDKMLIDMRDSGKSWDEIRKAWENMTGDKTAYSTLPNRYSRLKSNFVVIREEDNSKLIEAKHEIDAEYEREKWHKIADRMKEKGTEEYKADALKRQYQKLMVFSKELREEAMGSKKGGKGGDEEMDVE